MRILAFSDLHRDADAARSIMAARDGADLLVGAGDFGTRGEGAAETLSLFAKCDRPVIVVHGNHDDPGEVSALCHASKTLHYLHGGAVVVGGVSFFGVGGEIPGRNAFPWNAAETENDAARMMDDCDVGGVLVAHTPPHRLADRQRDGSHEGAESIRRCVDTKTPRLVLCGHIHAAWGLRADQGLTHVANLGPTINWFEL